MKILGVALIIMTALLSLKNGFIEGASHEERFSRVKFDNRFPKNTVEWLRDTYDDWEFAAFTKKKPTLNSNLTFANIQLQNLYLLITMNHML